MALWPVERQQCKAALCLQWRLCEQELIGKQWGRIAAASFCWKHKCESCAIVHLGFQSLSWQFYCWCIHNILFCCSLWEHLVCIVVAFELGVCLNKGASLNLVWELQMVLMKLLEHEGKQMVTKCLVALLYFVGISISNTFQTHRALRVQACGGVSHDVSAKRRSSCVAAAVLASTTWAWWSWSCARGSTRRLPSRTTTTRTSGTRTSSFTLRQADRFGKVPRVWAAYQNLLINAYFFAVSFL